MTIVITELFLIVLKRIYPGIEKSGSDIYIPDPD